MPLQFAIGLGPNPTRANDIPLPTGTAQHECSDGIDDMRNIPIMRMLVSSLGTVGIFCLLPGSDSEPRKTKAAAGDLTISINLGSEHESANELISHQGSEEMPASPAKTSANLA